MKPLRTRLALAVTAALLFALFALIEAMRPLLFIPSMNGLFHGLNFQEVTTSEHDISLPFSYALVVVAGWVATVRAPFPSQQPAA